jgi:hypothetical protein
MADGDAQMDVKLTGEPQGKLLELPEGLQRLFEAIWEFTLGALEPYVLPHGRST